MTALRERGQDLHDRWQKVREAISDQTHFTPDSSAPPTFSEWWKTGKAGAAFIQGSIDNQPAVLKIQGSKPKTNEAEMIRQFSAQNNSSRFRAPKIYASIPWNAKAQYEAIILESVKAPHPLTKTPLDDTEFQHYIDIYQDYKAYAITQPWLSRPKFSPVQNAFQDWLNATKFQRSKSNLYLDSDLDLIYKAKSILKEHISESDLEFMHGHYESGSMKVLNQEETVIFANLYWSWRIPFYDITFAYQWWMLGLEAVPSLTSAMIDSERKKWLDTFYNLDVVKSKKDNEKWFNLALLERAIPGLMTDSVMIDDKNPNKSLILSEQRKELKRLVGLFRTQ